MASGSCEVLLLVVTHIEEDGCTFSAQKHTPTSSADLDSIAMRLQKHARSSGTKVDPLKVNHASLKDKVFAAQYLDGTWYRCRLLFTTRDAKCLVQYIDYGDCEEKLVASLMDIPLDICESVLPGMAERYRLHGIKLNDDDIDKAVQYIETACSGSYMKAEVVMKADAQPSSPRSVTLFDEKGNSIATALIDLGYAIEEFKVKPDVVLSPPPVPPAQLYKNPLLSSPKYDRKRSVSDILDVSISRINSATLMKNPGVDVAGNSSPPSAPKNPAECGRCETNKETAEKMRLYVVRLRWQLQESEKQAAELEKSKLYWKKLHDDLQQNKTHLQPIEDEPSNTNVCGADYAPACFHEAASPDMKSGFANDSELENPSKNDTFAASTVTEMTPREKIETHVDDLYPPALEQSVDYYNDENGSTTIKEIPQLTEYVGSVPLQCKMNGSVISTEAMSGFMKKIIMPALSYFKTLTNSNSIVESCAAYEVELNEIVGKIKMRVENDEDCKEANRLGLTTRRHTVVENLKQSLQHTVQVLAKDADEMDNNVAGHTKGLHDIFSNFGDGDQSNANDALLVSDVEVFMKDVKTRVDLSTLCKMIMDGLYQQLDKFVLYKKRRSQFQQVLADITAYEGHERTIKDLTNENRGIRKRKQVIRLLVTEIRNLEEQVEDATPTELKDLEMQICVSRDKLSAERQKIHESFEARWHLMENLADMVEKFCPELQIEYKELGISDYINEEGIVMKGMEADHFDINEKEGQDYMNAVVYSTEYRGGKISLHKYVIRKVPLVQVLKRMSIYSNVECEYNLLPMGVFVSSEAAYVMVTKPPVTAIPIYKAGVLNDDTIEIVLKDIATALNSLHESGITHGIISKECIMYAGNAAVPHAFLSVPNFFADQDLSLQTLANDIVQYGMLAKSLASKNCPPKIEAIISTCANESNTITMRNVLALF